MPEGRTKSVSGLLASVELRGFEPLTFSLRTRRATNCATAPRCEGTITPRRPAYPIDPHPRRSWWIVGTQRRESTTAGASPAPSGRGGYVGVDAFDVDGSGAVDVA